MDKRIIDRIKTPADLRALYNDKDTTEGLALLDKIAEEYRGALINSVSKNGGHLSANLGAVELTMALHLAFNCPTDSFVFDVGHQSYVHKMITGRLEGFESLRKRGGISGFPKTTESEFDVFNTGHSGTSISAALGIARAKKLKGDPSYTVAVIGDGAFTGGMCFEALDDCVEDDVPLIIVLNDNSMAIAKTVGGIGIHFAKLRTSRPYTSLKRSTHRLLDKFNGAGKKIALCMERIKNKIKYLMLPNAVFEAMGVNYIGTINGHDISAMLEAFSSAKKMRRPVLVHIVTKKGKGYRPAEENPDLFHGVGAFDIENPMSIVSGKGSNSKTFGDKLLALAEENVRIVAVTAAMPESTGLIPFAKRFPERFFDVAIAEQHAVTMAAGMAQCGMLPVVCIYSTFLQRAYDQLLHDVCLQRLPMVIGVDRAGLVGEDGETHQGIYDIAYFLSMPGFSIFSPSTKSELEAMLELALTMNRPIAIRYNRGTLSSRELSNAVEFGKWEKLKPLSKVNIIVTGRLVETAMIAAEGLDVGIINARFISPMDYETLMEIRTVSEAIVTLEDGIIDNGFGSQIARAMSVYKIPVHVMGIPNKPITQASVKEQDIMCGICSDAIRYKLLGLLK